MGVNKVIYNNTTLIDLTGDTVTADTLAEGVVAHDKSGERIVGTMVASGGTSENHITEVGVMIGGEPVSIRDDGSRVTTVVNADESIVETRTFLDGTTETRTTVFNDDETVTETTVANGETTTKVTTFTDLGEIVMCTDNGNQVHRGDVEPDASLGIDGDVYLQIGEVGEEYTVAEYIESSGTQYIDTGVTATQNIGYEIDFLTDSALVNNNNFGAILCCITSGTNRFGFDTYTAYSGGSLYYGSTVHNPDIIVGKRMTVSLMNGVLKTPSAETTLPANTFNVGASVALFARKWNTGTIDGYSKTRIYACRMYDGSVLIRDYIPVLDWSDVPCLYDRVSGECYYNAGTGVFTAGSAIGGVDGLPTEIKEIAMYMKINGAWTLLAEVA